MANANDRESSGQQIRGLIFVLHQRLGDQEAIRQEETRSIEAPLDARLAALDAEFTQMGHTLDQLYNSMDQVDPAEDGRWWD